MYIGSTTEQNVYKNLNLETETTTQFHDATRDYVTDFSLVQTDKTMTTADSDMYGLEKFFARPINIRNFQWVPGVAFGINFDPWNNFFSDPRVSNRISNYKFTRGTLCMKFMINGNGFYYGRLLASYQPLRFYDSTIDPPQNELRLSQRTQTPHIFLDPTSSQGGILKVPLLWPKNGFDLVNDNPARIGKTYLTSFGPLGHANDGTDPVSIDVWAWMEDIKLEVPTSSNANVLTPQSGDGECNEYKGIVSKPALAISAAAGKLSSIPAIAPYARATQMVSRGIGEVARAFGYSKVNTVQDPVPYTPRYMGNMASTQGIDTSVSLAGDPKRELSIDPRTLGLPPVDELHFDFLRKVEGYIGNFTWSTGDSRGTILNEILVTPQQFIKEESDGVDYYHFAPTAFMSLPFEFWRGTLKFRFQVTASNFHRGRLRIAYDPLDGPASDGDENVHLNKVVDIANERDFTMEVKWGTEWPWLYTIDPKGLDPPFGTDVIGAFDTWQHNGVLSVQVMTDLTSPSSSAADIRVNVFVSAGDDFEVAFPTDTRLGTMQYFTPQSADEEDTSANAPVKGDTDFTILTSDPEGSTQDVFFGDPFVSFRSVLKRYHRCDVRRHLDTGLSRVSLSYPHRPLYPGQDLNGVHTTSTALPINYVENTLLGYVLSAYSVWRGSIRWKTYIGSASSSAPVIAALDNDATVVPKWDATSLPTLTTDSQWSYVAALESNGLAGSIGTASEQNPVLEFEAPWMQNLRFSTSRQLSVLNTNPDEAEWIVQERGHRYQMLNDGSVYVERRIAAGDDLLVGMFVGLPVVIYDNFLPPETP